jgi:hypothetical protein
VQWIRDLWRSVRDTSFVAAQVITLGAIAMALTLVALNAIVYRAASAAPTPSGPTRPLALLVQTIVPDTPTPHAAPAATSTPVPRVQTTNAETIGTAAAMRPGWSPPVAPEPSPVATERPIRIEPTPEPTATARPSPPAATATSVPTGPLLKVLPAPDGLPARVRAEPNTRAPILVRVPLGASVEAIGTASGDEIQPGNPRWVRIRWKDVTGFVHSSLLGAG